MKENKVYILGLEHGKMKQKLTSLGNVSWFLKNQIRYALWTELMGSSLTKSYYQKRNRLFRYNCTWFV